MSKRIIIYGPSKIGISSFLSKNKDALFINPGDGLRFLNCKTIKDSSTYVSILEAVDKLTNVDHKYKTLVIDHLIALERLIIDYICETNKISHVDYFSYGKGHQLAFLELQKFLTKLDALSASKNMTIVLVGHAVNETYSTLFQENLTKSILYSTLRPPKENVGDWLKIWSDALLYVDNYMSVAGQYKKNADNSPIMDSEMIHVFTQQRPTFDAGNRFGWDFSYPLDWNAFKDNILNKEVKHG